MRNNIAKTGVANAHCIFQHGLEDRIKVALRTRDDLQHLGGRSLLLQRFAQLVEQPCVLDGDDGLIGKRFYKLDLLPGVWPRVGALKC